ncbi:hypothetical protein [uncultured Flavobacterium sp.]|uniref:hypothetical protein n=1 Tax=uncultured Flavobacterium sp. TaxID=165435 RepID=UPI0025D29C2A|nr:hypothetical protein [uncultured Flavobacterium sp.]
MVSPLAPMVATILLWRCSPRKIVHPAGKWMAEIARPFAPKPRNNLGKDFVTIEAQK